MKRVILILFGLLAIGLGWGLIKHSNEILKDVPTDINQLLDQNNNVRQRYVDLMETAGKERKIAVFQIAVGGLCVLIALFSRSKTTERVRRRIIHKKSKTLDVERFQCPECGEPIPTAAKICRFCNAMLTDKDKPADSDTPN